VVKVGLSGGTLAYKDQELTLYGYGVAAQVWMSLNYSPVLDAYRRDRDGAQLVEAPPGCPARAAAPARAREGGVH